MGTDRCGYRDALRRRAYGGQLSNHSHELSDTAATLSQDKATIKALRSDLGQLARIIAAQRADISNLGQQAATAFRSASDDVSAAKNKERTQVTDLRNQVYLAQRMNEQVRADAFRQFQDQQRQIAQLQPRHITSDARAQLIAAVRSNPGVKINLHTPPGLADGNSLVREIAA